MKTFFAANPKEWRNWLKNNFRDEKEVWLIFHKKETKKACISYEESVEEALCYGWIDSLIKKIDDEKYARKFTPRMDKNKWSPSNIIRIKKLIASGRMTKNGMEKINDEILNTKPEQQINPTEGSGTGIYHNGNTDLIRKPNSKALLPSVLEKILRKNKKAWNNFNKLAPSYQNLYIKWITYAKKEETQLKRLNEAIEKLERGEKLGLK